MYNDVYNVVDLFVNPKADEDEAVALTPAWHGVKPRHDLLSHSEVERNTLSSEI